MKYEIWRKKQVTKSQLSNESVAHTRTKAIFSTTDSVDLTYLDDWVEVNVGGGFSEELPGDLPLREMKMVV